MSMAEERSSDSVQSVEIPSDMYNLLQNGQSITIPGESEYESTDLMQLTVMKGLQEPETKPHLKILEQPRQRGFRFRYGCEGPSHGGLPGNNSQRGKRSFPSVEICRYKGPARIVVSLVTNEETPRPHAHSLVGKHCKEGLCTVQVGPKDMTASFPNLGILHVTRKDVVPTLKKRILEQHRLYNSLISDTHGGSEPRGWSQPSDDDVEKKAKEMAKDMDLSVVRLCFQTYLPDSNGHFTQPLDPVISVPVFDSKAPNATTLKICRMDKSAGCCTGGEEVYLLCDKVQKEDIQVRFFELSADGQITWQKYAEFGPTDVHRQYAIVFKTPSYRDINIDRPVYVHVQLKRKSDHETSDPKPFTYHPQVPDREGILRKRKKHLAHFNEYSGYQSSSSLGGGGGIGGGGGGSSFQFPGGFGTGAASFGGSNYSGNQMTSAANQTQQVSPQVSSQTNVVSSSNANQAMTFTPVSTAPQTRQPLPSIETLTPNQRQQQQQQFQLQQRQHQQQQMLLQQPPQQQQQQTQQQHQMQPQLNFQLPQGLNFQTPVHGGAAGGQIKMENDNNNKQFCMDTSVGEFQLDADVRRDCGMSETFNNPDLISKGVSKKVQRSKDVEEKIVQTDEMPIDTDSMAWRVAQVTANALHDYAATGDIKTILTVQRHLIAVEDDNGDTPLHAAVINKKYDVIHSLLAAVIKIPDQKIVNQVNHLKQTPLHLAAITKQSKMVEVLLRCGADPNLCDRDGNTPLHVATKNGHVEGATFLVRGPKAKAAVTPIKAEVNTRNYEGLAPAHLAVLGRNLDILKLLVSAGADANLADGKTGRSPLHYAVEVEDFPILGYLLIDAKVDVGSVAFSGDAPLHLASSLDLRAVAALLLAAGADPKRENGDVESEDDEGCDGIYGDGDDGCMKEVKTEEGECEWKDRQGKTAYQLARSEKMREILTGRSAVLSQSVKDKRLEYRDAAINISSAGSLRNESVKADSSDHGYFSEKLSEEKRPIQDGWKKGYGLLPPSLITKGDMHLLPHPTRTHLASLLDEQYPVTQSWYTLASRLGLSNMLPFLRQVRSPTEVILSQYQAMDGTIDELRAVLSSMEHQKAVALIDSVLCSFREKVDDDFTHISVSQSLKELSLVDRGALTQVVY